MNKETFKHLDKELLRLEGSNAKDLEAEASGEKEVAMERLKLNHKASWSRTVKKLPEKELKEWPEEELPEAEVEVKKGVKRKADCDKAKSAKPKLPEDDGLKVVLAVAGRKRLCKENPPLKIRVGMLSARLKERFGYLCTETDT